MTRGTGFPAVQGPGLRTGRRPPSIVLLFAAILTLTAGSAQAVAADKPAEPDTPVDAAMEVIGRAFRAGKADLLASVLPREGKVFLSLSTIGEQAGYYGRDQVYFIFQEIFSRHRTIRFSINRLRASKGGGDGTGLTYCVGMWSFSRRNGQDGETQLHFVLSTRAGRSALVQIREAQ